jgi:hypothetical protein
MSRLGVSTTDFDISPDSVQALVDPGRDAATNVPRQVELRGLASEMPRDHTARTVANRGAGVNRPRTNGSRDG